jgi:hypothetical protein
VNDGQPLRGQGGDLANVEPVKIAFLSTAAARVVDNLRTVHGQTLRDDIRSTGGSAFQVRDHLRE